MLKLIDVHVCKYFFWGGGVLFRESNRNHANIVDLYKDWLDVHVLIS